MSTKPGSLGLPRTMQMIERDWLNANHVLLSGSDRAVLVDAGHVSSADRTVQLVREALNGRPLHDLVLTHTHSDHMGGCATLKRAFGCRITVPEGEAEMIRTWDTRALWLDYAGQHAERFDFENIIHPGDRIEMGDLEWETIAAPGHDMGAVVYWCAREGILISGDALWERSFGIVLPGEGWRERLAAARDTLFRLRSLGARIVIPGHGRVFADADGTIEACLSRVAAFEQDERRMARNVVKVMFVFALLERPGMTDEEIQRLFAEVPLYVEYAAVYFRLGSVELARTTLDELARTGALERDAGGRWYAR